MKGLLKFLIVVAVGFGIYGVVKPLPADVNITGSVYKVSASGVTFFEDTTYLDANDIRRSNQEIFDEVFRMIRNAEHYVLVDMFLFNDFLGTETESYRELSSELTNTLIAKKQARPNMSVILITDPLNELYGGYVSEQLDSLRAAGVEVVITDLDPLRDSNPIYSGFYRAYVSWFDNAPTDSGRFANPFDARLPDLGLRTYLSLFNFKANHRKILIADRRTSGGQKFSVLVTSANPHDGSSAHTNTAIRVDDFLWEDALRSERAVAEFSDASISAPSQSFLASINDQKGNVDAQFLTEKAIRDQVLAAIGSLKGGDSLDLAMFYLSDRKIIGALKRARETGVEVRILLDPNKDAFGREKNGVPNRPVAHELTNSRKPIDIRWCDTHGEQCHTKLLIASSSDAITMIQGSANYTRRNFANYNLETNILIRGNSSVPAIRDAQRYFEKVWNNEGNRKYSTAYEAYADPSKKKTFLYRLMEDLGTSTF